MSGPATPERLSQVVAVAAGWGFTVALGAGGVPRAAGRLPGAPGPPGAPPLPFESLRGVRVVAVAAGAAHCLFLDSFGACWSAGEGADGRLGRRDDVAPAPGRVELAECRFVACGAAHSLACGADGGVYAWGHAGAGRLGIGETNESKKTAPTIVDGLAGAVACAGGKYHSLVVAARGTALYAFGDNSYGQLGLGHADDERAPKRARLPDGAVVAHAAAGASHSLLLLENGDVYRSASKPLCG